MKWIIFIFIDEMDCVCTSLAWNEKNAHFNGKQKPTIEKCHRLFANFVENQSECSISWLHGKRILKHLVQKTAKRNRNNIFFWNRMDALVCHLFFITSKNDFFWKRWWSFNEYFSHWLFFIYGEKKQIEKKWIFCIRHAQWVLEKKNKKKCWHRGRELNVSIRLTKFISVKSESMKSIQILYCIVL